MKNKLIRIWTYINGWNGLIVSLYLYLIAFTIEYQLFYSINTIIVFVLSIITLFPVFLISPVLLRWINKITIFHYCSSIKIRTHFFIMFFSSLIIFCFVFIAFFPGGFNPDSLNQLKQALSGEYNDWHPYLHTLFAFSFPLLISMHAYWAIALFQLFCMSVSIAYMGITLLKYSNTKFAYLSVAVITLNPVICGSSVYAIKDTFVAVFVVLCLSFVLHIYYTNGKWLNSWINIVKYCVVLIAITFFRHNAILFSLPLLLISLLFIPKKAKISCVSIFACLFIICKIVIPVVVDVKQADKRQLETLGLPLTVLSDIYICDKDALDDETQVFMNKITSETNWNKYEQSNFNSVKWKGINSEIIEEAGAKKVLNMFLKACISSPRLAILSIMNLTSIVYQPLANSYASITTLPYIEQNDFGIEYKGNNQLRNMFYLYYDYIIENFSILFISIGSVNLFLLIATLSKCNLKHKKDRRKALLTVPVFLYNFGTMLLLTGSDYRFFLFSLFVVPIYTLLMFTESKEKSNEDYLLTQ